QGITVENRSGPRRSCSKNAVEMQLGRRCERRSLEADNGTASVDATEVSWVTLIRSAQNWE
ncbi:hypothetical protein A2U01_0104928, partial [Trifolium medium]|nr:hypothetical protein [Trifolium medium]